MWYYILKINGKDVVRGPMATKEIIDKIYWDEINKNTKLKYGVKGKLRRASYYDEIRPYLYNGESEIENKRLGKNTFFILAIIFVMIFLLMLEFK